MVEALRPAADRIDVEVVDALTFTPWWFRAYYAGGFAMAMTKFPTLYGLGFRLMNIPRRSRRDLLERMRLRIERLALWRLQRYLADRPPDLIVNTHFLAPPVIGRIISQGVLRCRQVTVVTDIHVHRFWYCEDVDHWFVPTDSSAETLRRWNIPDDRVTVSGIPIHPKWSRPLDRRTVLADWDLPADKQIVLLTGGTEYTCGPIGRIAREILRARDDAFVVVLTGRNKRLQGHLAEMAARHPRLRPVSFTDRSHELVEVASVMITKAGGITTAECLAKGTPMILLNPVPGHEAGNAAFLAGAGAAVIARGRRQIVETLANLLADPDRLAALAAGARQLHQPAADTVAHAIMDCCRAKPDPAAGA